MNAKEEAQSGDADRLEGTHLSTNRRADMITSRLNDIFPSVRLYTQSKKPAIFLGALFASSVAIPPSVLRPNAGIPPLLHRVGFSAVFGGAAYVLSTGDARNGSGIATAWSLIYLFLNFRKSLRAPRHPLSLAMTGGVTACAALYGTEYFLFQTV